jgi:hypothetical protein
MPGEINHQIGADGTRRAKAWLDSTTRVESCWTIEDTLSISRLEYGWPHGGQNFSFDLGGVLSGGEFHKTMFVAESKKYSSPADQGEHYDDWLAKCYVMRMNRQPCADHFMFITWNPFRANSWQELVTPKAISTGLLKEKNRKRVFSVDQEERARSMIDQGLLEDVASRLWLIVLSDKQEKLVISDADRAIIVSHRVASGGV